MDITSVPPTVFVAFGVITAAVLTGFFSYVNMVSSKENKVSEFRLAWIDGLRNEIAEYTSAAQELVRVAKRFAPGDFHTPQEKHSLSIDFYKETRDAFARAVENLSRIQLRLNPQDVKDNPDSPEAKLMSAVSIAREYSAKGEFREVLDSCNVIRAAAAPILKETWDRVKRGEPGYQRIRRYALLTVAIGFYTIVLFGGYIGVSTLNNRAGHTPKATQEHVQANQPIPTVVPQAPIAPITHEPSIIPESPIK